LVFGISEFFCRYCGLCQRFEKIFSLIMLKCLIPHHFSAGTIEYLKIFIEKWSSGPFNIEKKLFYKTKSYNFSYFYSFKSMENALRENRPKKITFTCFKSNSSINRKWEPK
jgi:hypothetical protein